MVADFPFKFAMQLIGEFCCTAVIADLWIAAHSAGNTSNPGDDRVMASGPNS